MRSFKIPNMHLLIKLTGRSLLLAAWTSSSPRIVVGEYARRLSCFGIFKSASFSADISAASLIIMLQRDKYSVIPNLQDGSLQLWSIEVDPEVARSAEQRKLDVHASILPVHTASGQVGNVPDIHSRKRPFSPGLR